jgi:hypothetical protein
MWVQVIQDWVQVGACYLEVDGSHPGVRASGCKSSMYSCE